MKDLNAIPVLSEHVMTRKDSNGMLLFEIPTDEMYFVTDDGFFLISLCNGSQTLGEIISGLNELQPESGSDALKTELLGFYSELEKRKLIHFWE